MSAAARGLIAALHLVPHPEGGWYRETWRAAAPPGVRAAATAILFLLDAGQRSHWHCVDADELWFWHAGSALTLSLAAGDAGPVAQELLGPDIAGGALPQRRVPAGWWQAAAPAGGWALVSCVVSPAFEFAGFALAASGWSPGAAAPDPLSTGGGCP